MKEPKTKKKEPKTKKNELSATENSKVGLQGQKKFSPLEKTWGMNSPRSFARILLMACSMLHARSGKGNLLLAPEELGQPKV